MSKFLRLPVFAAVFLATVSICSAGDHLRAFNHTANGDFTATTASGFVHGRAAIHGHFHDNVLTLTITAHSTNGRTWHNRITFSGGAHRFDIHNSLPFDSQNIQTSSGYRAYGSGANIELSGTQLIGASGHGQVFGTLRVERIHGKYIFDLTIQEPQAKPSAKSYDFFFFGA